MKYLFIVNPIAGVGGKRHFPELISQFCIEKQIVHKVLFTRCPGDAIEIVQQYFDHYDAFVAVGCDGTTNELVTALAGKDKLMGLIPAGSGNALGRQLGISLTASSAMKQLCQSQPLTIDTGIINQRRFVNVAGLGFDNHVARCYAQNTFRGAVPYISHVVKEFPLYTSSSYEIEIDGKLWAGKAFVVSVANSSQYGNNAFIAPRAIINDGWLDLCIMHPFPVGMAPEMAIRLLNKQLDNSRCCEYFRAKKIVIKGYNLNFHVDGEPVTNQETIEINIDPQSLRVLTPKPN